MGAGLPRPGVGIGVIEEDQQTLRLKARQKAEDDYKEGMKARAAGDTATAVRILLAVAKMESQRIDSEYPPKAFAELQVIFEEGRKDLQVARDLVAGEDPAAGVSELKRILRTYLGLGPAKDAGKLLAQLEKDPKFQATLKAAKLTEDLRRAEALEAQAEAVRNPPAAAAPAATSEKPAAKPAAVGAVTVRQKDLTPAERQAKRAELLLDAYDLYGRIAQQGTGTEPARKAAAACERLEKDADLMARLKIVQGERKARELMSLADNYFRAGRFDTAREHCKKVLAEYPQSMQAVDAKMLMERMAK